MLTINHFCQVFLIYYFNVFKYLTSQYLETLFGGVHNVTKSVVHKI